MKNINAYIKSHSKTLYWVLFSLVLAVLVFIQYYGVVHFHYPDTPGDDSLNHWTMAQSIKDSGKGLFEAFRSGGYPPFYHFTMAKISTILNIPTMSVMLWTYPAIIIFASLAAFLLAFAVFKNKWIALLALVLYAFSTRTPIQLLHDGGYPNLIAAHILLPTAIAFLILAWRSKAEGGGLRAEESHSSAIANAAGVIARSEATKQSRLPRPLRLAMTNKKILLYILGGLFTVLVPLTHHISTFEMLGVAITATPILLVAAWIKNKWKWWKGIIWLAVYGLLLAVLGYLYFNSPIFAPFRGLASIMIVVSNKFPFVKSLIRPEDAAIIPWASLPGRIGRLVVPLALVFVPLFSFFKPLRERKFFYSLLLVSVWSLLLLVLSQSTLFTNPERLARDSALPLSVLASGSIFYIGQFLSKQKMLLAAFIAICLFLAYSPVKDRFYNALHYEPMVRVTQADLKALDAIKDKPSSTILVNGWNYFLMKYLPDWDVDYTSWLSDQEQTILENPGYDEAWPRLNNYQYIYITDSQLGWAPGTRFGYAVNYLSNDNFTLLGDFSSPTNHIYIFENNLYHTR